MIFSINGKTSSNTTTVLQLLLFIYFTKSLPLILKSIQAIVAPIFDNDNTITLGVSLTVSLALPKVINVTAKVYRESSAPLNICEILQNNLGDAINNYAQLGRDISLAFLHSQLFIKNNISRIEIIEPTNDVILSANEFAKAGEIKIIDGGVQW